MAEIHLHSRRLSVSKKLGQQSSRSIDDSITATLQNSYRLIYRLQHELALKADEFDKSESAVHCLRDIQSASENLLGALEAYEAMLYTCPLIKAHISPVEPVDITLGNPVPCPKLSAHQEKELAHFQAQFYS